MCECIYKSWTLSSLSSRFLWIFAKFTPRLVIKKLTRKLILACKLASTKLVTRTTFMFWFLPPKLHNIKWKAHFSSNEPITLFKHPTQLVSWTVNVCQLSTLIFPLHSFSLSRIQTYQVEIYRFKWKQNYKIMLGLPQTMKVYKLYSRF